MDEAGTRNTSRDVFGHEKRVTLALEGKWDQISKGGDHLAPVTLESAPAARVAATKPKQESFFDSLSSVISGRF